MTEKTTPVPSPTAVDDVFVVPVDELDEEAAALDPVRLYLNAIGKVPLLNAEQEVELAQRIEAGLYAEQKLAAATTHTKGGDGASLQVPKARMTPALKRDLEWLAEDGQRAKEHLLAANLRLVVSVAKRYARPSMPFLDLVQEGNIGLVRAVEKFDYQRGFKFSTYATWWIRQAMTRGIAEQGRTIRLPVHLVEQVNKIARLRRVLAAELGREPTSEEIGAAVDLAPERVEDILRSARDPISLDRTLDDDGTSEFADFVVDDDIATPDEVLTRRLLREEIDNALHGLDERESFVVAARFGLLDGREHTLAEIGDRLHLTRERIRQIEREALGKLRHADSVSTLKEYAAG
ncbi:MAG: sigma-70 family RNA polymerase sigma factor [Actinomycetes bacterium]